MKNKVSTEYAEALFALALEEEREEDYYKTLTEIKKVFNNEPEYLELLSAPGIDKNEKNQILDATFEGKIDENILSFLKLLTERGRISLFNACYEEFFLLYNAKRSTLVVEVTSAVELTNEEKEKIKAKLESKFKLKVQLECVVDSSILGGLIIKTDDTIIDGSLKRKLRDVKDVISK